MKQIKIYAEVLEDEALKQFNDAMALECVVAGALMPDAHTGYSLPIGAVVAVKDHVSPAFVGYDIGCGMCAVKLDLDYKEIDKEYVFTKIYESIPVGFKQHDSKKQVPISENVSDIVSKHLERKGVFQMGTLGGGNHFIEVGKGNDDKVWVIIHSGSRNIGHAVAEHYMKLAAKESINYDEHDQEFEDKNMTFKKHNPDGFNKAMLQNRTKIKTNIEGQYFFHSESENGKQYINDMNYCLEYALENRKMMIDKIIYILGNPKRLIFINRNHNHAELKDGLWIHRKGATHAEDGMLGVIPANMRDGSFIVKGKGNKESLCSSSHGAGRVLSRSQAHKTLSMQDFKNTMVDVVAKVDINTLDESPMAYKNIFEVMELQKDLVEIIDRVIPLINIKG